MELFFRIVVIFVVIYVCYKFVRYLFDPKRKLNEAYKNGQFYFYDDAKNIRKNFFIAYKGALLEGEKYLASTTNTSEIISIFVSVHNLEEIDALTKDDFLFLQNEIAVNYPDSTISWISPIEKRLKT